MSLSPEDQRAMELFLAWWDKKKEANSNTNYQRGYNDGYEAAMKLKQPCRCKGEI